MNPYIQYMYSYPHKTAYRSLDGISLREYASLLSGGGHGLYLHIPFCQIKCGYCNLFSVTGQGKDQIDRYLDAVERQSIQYQERLFPFHAEFSEVCVGGGTPLLLTEDQLRRMFYMLENYFDFSKNREMVIETAPNQTTREKLKILKKAGVTRISIGIQSFSDEELKTLGRQHHAQRASEAMELLKSFDFSCVNMDFIYGIPGQTAGSLLDSLRNALVYEPDEIFLYPLYVKHGAELERELNQGMVLDADAAFLQYQEGSRFLRAAGFRQDSMRRFVRGKNKRRFSECGFGTSLALGCGGRSYLGNLHFCSPYAITREGCLARLEEFENTFDHTAVTHGILLSEEELKRRYVIRHLLIRPGLPMKQYEEHFGSQATEDFPLLKDWLESGYIEYSQGTESYLTLTEAGLGLSDHLGPQLISGKVREKMEEWEAVHGKTYDTVPRQSEKL